MGIIIFIVLFIIKTVISWLILHFFFNGDSDAMINAFTEELTVNDYKLLAYFFGFYIVGTICLFPPNLVLVAMAYTFTHKFDPYYGLALTIVFNYIA